MVGKSNRASWRNGGVVLLAEGGICSAPAVFVGSDPGIRIWPDLTASIASPKPVEMAWSLSGQHSGHGAAAGIVGDVAQFAGVGAGILEGQGGDQVIQAATGGTPGNLHLGRVLLVGGQQLSPVLIGGVNFTASAW